MLMRLYLARPGSDRTPWVYVRFAHDLVQFKAPMFRDQNKCGHTHPNNMSSRLQRNNEGQNPCCFIPLHRAWALSFLPDIPFSVVTVLLHLLFIGLTMHDHWLRPDILVSGLYDDPGLTFSLTHSQHKFC